MDLQSLRENVVALSSTIHRRATQLLVPPAVMKEIQDTSEPDTASTPVAAGGWPYTLGGIRAVEVSGVKNIVVLDQHGEKMATIEVGE